MWKKTVISPSASASSSLASTPVDNLEWDNLLAKERKVLQQHRLTFRPPLGMTEKKTNNEILYHAVNKIDGSNILIKSVSLKPNDDLLETMNSIEAAYRKENYTILRRGSMTLYGKTVYWIDQEQNLRGNQLGLRTYIFAHGKVLIMLMCAASHDQFEKYMQTFDAVILSIRND